MKKIATLGLIGAMSLSTSCQQQTATPKTDEDKTFYTMGSLMGTRLKSIDLTENEISMIVQGLKDSANGKESQVDLNKYRGEVQGIFRKRMQKNTDKFKVSGAKYLENFLAKEGGKKTESGIGYKILKDGSGKKPKSTDSVEVHYHGTLIDGKVFDSSVDRKKKVSFPLNRVIKCWTEGMQLIGVGGKIRLVCPSELAYGDNGAPPRIPGGSTLIFDVELFSINSESKKEKKVSLKKEKK